ncbi:MAG: hypothetical protein ABI769_11175 [Pseudomonadota bacterium]
MNEKPLERLNYYNGQRLQAADLKLEQDYHIRVRRWLNRSLYSAGIAEGLAVYAIKGQPKVRVTPGLAIDHLGREIILLEEAVIDVVDGYHGGGPYLTIRYREEVLGKSEESCRTNGHCADRPAWGGPERILAEPVLELSTGLPNEASGRIALAALKLGANCDMIDAVDLGVRRYIGEGSANKVKQYALEGVRDIDARNPAKIIFHVRGRQPTSVSLFLRAEKFPSLYYTEMGNHTHANGGTLTLPSHTHGEGTSDPAGSHTPTVTSVKANVDADVWGGMLGVIAVACGVAAPFATTAAPGFVALGTELGGVALGNFANNAINPDADFMDLTLSPNIFHHRPGDPNCQRELKSTRAVNMNIDLQPVLDHSHTIASFPANGADWVITFTGTGSSVSVGAPDAGTESYAARSAAAITYVKNVEVWVDNQQLTTEVRQQIIANSPGGTNWSEIGGGTANHELVVNGTGDIRIDFLPGVVLSEGEHTIELKVGSQGNGGRIHFNLYVE